MSASTHRISVAVRQHTQEVCGCPCVSVCVRQHTQDLRGCPSAHTGRPCVSVCTPRTSVAVRVCPSANTGRPWLSISTHISLLVLGISTLTLPVTVRGCLLAHTGCPWLSVCVRMCPSANTRRLWVSVSTHRTSVWVRQHTQDVCGCPCVSVNTLHAGPSRELFG